MSLSYDLTAFLTTIAASSASIVAILGGFIASKLISISGERTAVLDKLHSIDEELSFKHALEEKLQKENNAEDAFTFIRKHINMVIDKVDLDKVFDPAENQGITKDKIAPYWKRALEISTEWWQLFSHDDTHDDTEIMGNSDGIPLSLATKYANDAFSYKVLNAMLGHFTEAFNLTKRKPVTKEDITLKPAPPNQQYLQNEQEILKLNTDISYLELLKKQFEEQRIKLTQPKGMKAGLIIFAVFSLLCIITPLAMCPRYYSSFFEFWFTKLFILFLFIASMAAIFIYLLKLLQWKENSEQHEGEQHNSK